MSAAAPALLDYDALCAKYPFARGTVQSWVSKKKIPFIRLGPRHVVFEVDAIEAWLASKRIDPTAK